MEDFKRYKILKPLGAGGMAEVYLAFDLNLQCNVALKFFKLDDSSNNFEELSSLFHKEAQILAKLNHPNIVRIFDLSSHDEKFYISMEYIEGLTLRQYLLRHQNITKEKKLDILKQVLKGLEVIHQSGLVHRDLKPDNIIVGDDNVVKIVDFGVVKNFNEKSLFNNECGTPNYMAPEQFDARGADYRSDIFAIGVIFYELFIGKNPFKGRDLQETVKNINTLTIKKLNEIDPNYSIQISNVVDKCLNKVPSQRYQNVLSLNDDIKNIILYDDFNSKEKRKSKLLISSIIFAFFTFGLYLVTPFGPSENTHDLLSANCDYRETSCFHKIKENITSASKKHKLLTCGDNICTFLEQKCGHCPKDCISNRASLENPVCLFLHQNPPQENWKKTIEIYRKCYLESALEENSNTRKFSLSIYQCLIKNQDENIRKCKEANYDLFDKKLKFVYYLNECILTGGSNI